MTLPLLLSLYLLLILFVSCLFPVRSKRGVMTVEDYRRFVDRTEKDLIKKLEEASDTPLIRNLWDK